MLEYNGSIIASTELNVLYPTRADQELFERDPVRLINSRVKTVFNISLASDEDKLLSRELRNIQRAWGICLISHAPKPHPAIISAFRTAADYEDDLDWEEERALLEVVIEDLHKEEWLVEDWGRQAKLHNLLERKKELRGGLRANPIATLVGITAREVDGIADEFWQVIRSDVDSLRSNYNSLWRGCVRELTRILQTSEAEIEELAVKYATRTPEEQAWVDQQDNEFWREHEQEEKQWQNDPVRRKIYSIEFRNQLKKEPVQTIQKLTAEEVKHRRFGGLVLLSEINQTLVDEFERNPALITACAKAQADAFSCTFLAKNTERWKKWTCASYRRNIIGCLEAYKKGKELVEQAERAARENGDFTWTRDVGTSDVTESSSTESSEEKAEIWTSNRQLGEVTQQVVTEIKKRNNPPRIFLYAEKPARIVPSGDSSTKIEILSESSARELFTRVADFYHVRKGKVAVSPGIDVVRNFLALGQWPFPTLNGIITTPVFGADRRLIITPGYNLSSRLFYHPTADLVNLRIPLRPSHVDVTAAVALWHEAFCDFPFVDSAGFANLLAATLSLIVRIISGRPPLAAINKTSAGTGAGLVVEVIARVLTGAPASILTIPRSSEEFRKKLTALLLSGARIIVLDNVETRLESEHLAAILTADFWEDRILGRSETVRLPQNAIWFCTANNLQLGGDLPRRAFEIRLDAKIPKPWKRTGFKHPELLDWVQKNRIRLLGALFVMAQSWIAAGEPQAKGLPTLGGFQPWVKTVGSILAHVGVSGFLENIDAFHDRMDTSSQEWEYFLTVWHEIHADSPVSIAALADSLFKEHMRLAEAMPEELAKLHESGHPLSTRQRLGHAIARKEGTLFGQYRLERAGTESRGGRVLWKVAKVEQ